MNATWDYAILGAGLSGGMTALALRQLQPQARLVLIERGEQPAGNHTWSFHSLDVPPAAEAFVRPCVAKVWPEYRVRFPGYERVVPCAYAAITVESFTKALSNRLSPDQLRLGQAVQHCTHHEVTLASGETLSARCVIDARGPASDLPSRSGFQKFVGLEIESETPWPYAHPIIMDADLPQDDGYRFVYVLPFSPYRLLVEETYFADGPALDGSLLRQRIAGYLQQHGLHHWRVVREESGVLPMPWSGLAAVVSKGGPLLAGYAGGWFHPATGYSFPAVVRYALAVAGVPPEEAAAAAQQLALTLAPRQAFGRFLNRLLFCLVTPQQRWQIFRRLYRSLPDAVLNRFYALEFGRLDAVRLIAGWPPPLSPSRLIVRPEVSPCLQPMS